MTVPAFPSSIVKAGYPIMRTPLWDTLDEPAISGKRTRYPQRNLPLYQYEIIFEYLRQDAAYLEWQTLLGFFNKVFGSAYMFSFDDPNDDTATLEPFGEGDGSTTVFQLTRAGNFGFAEPVFCVTGTPNIYVDGVLQTVTTNYTIDKTTGLVTFQAGYVPASGKPLTWTGTFSWYCRFDDDKMAFSNFAKNFWELKKVNFSTELL